MVNTQTPEDGERDFSRHKRIRTKEGMYLGTHPGTIFLGLIFLYSIFGLVEAAGDGDFGLAEGVDDLCFAEARSVVLKGHLLPRIVEAKAAQAVSISEFAEPVQLIVAQRGLQFVSNFHEGHGGIIPAAAISMNPF